MEIRICACGCKTPFEPVIAEQIYFSDRCANRVRQRRWYERHKRQKPKPGGGPGGKRQAMLFSRSELHRRKPNKAALVPKPKPGDLFPPDEGIGRDYLASLGGAVEYAGKVSVSDNAPDEPIADYSKYSVKPATLPSQAKPEATLAA